MQKQVHPIISFSFCISQLKPWETKFCTCGLIQIKVRWVLCSLVSLEQWKQRTRVLRFLLTGNQWHVWVGNKVRAQRASTFFLYLIILLPLFLMIPPHPTQLNQNTSHMAFSAAGVVVAFFPMGKWHIGVIVFVTNNRQVLVLLRCLVGWVFLACFFLFICLGFFFWLFICHFFA